MIDGDDLSLSENGGTDATASCIFSRLHRFKILLLCLKMWDGNSRSKGDMILYE